MARAGDQLELRGLYDREVVEALDMIALAKGMTRADLVGRVVTAYVVHKQHEASLVAKTARINPPPMDSGWSPLE
jgi:hypothetical protein